MALFEINADLKALVRVLERIADTLERMAPPAPDDSGPPPDGTLMYVTDEDLADEREKEFREKLKDLTPAQQEALVRELFNER